MNKYLKVLAVSAGLVFSSQVALAETCIDIGGVALGNFLNEGDEKPLIVSAVLTGFVDSAAGKILDQRETETGFDLDIEHYFTRADGGTIHTRDEGVLTAIPGKAGRFMLEITYEVQEGRGRGSLKDYTGTFRSFGLVDLRDRNDLKGLVRYSGELCK